MTNIRILNPNAAGVDIGTREIFISVADQPVVRFDTFTAGLHQALAYLLEQGVETVAMEATGVYWMPIYEVFEAGGLRVCLVNGADTKRVPSRKSDVMDCQWLQELHSYGLLSAGFVPEAAIRALRSYVRQRQDHLEMAAMQVQHMQKALDLMNIKLHTVISQIQGVSGLRMIEAMLAGERDPEVLADLCTAQIQKNKRARVVASLQGQYRAEHLFALGQALIGYRFYQDQRLVTAAMRACDGEIERHLAEMTAGLPSVEALAPPKPMRHNQPQIDDLQQRLLHPPFHGGLTGGREVSHLVGLSDASVLKLISELGTDLSKWPSEKHFTSYLGLAPGSHQSGQRRRKRRRRVKSRAGQVFVRVHSRSVRASIWLWGASIVAFGRVAVQPWWPRQESWPCCIIGCCAMVWPMSSRGCRPMSSSIRRRSCST